MSARETRSMTERGCLSHRGAFWTAYGLLVASLVAFWAVKQLHHDTGRTLHQVCKVYACTPSVDTTTTPWKGE